MGLFGTGFIPNLGFSGFLSRIGISGLLSRLGMNGFIPESGIYGICPVKGLTGFFPFGKKRVLPVSGSTPSWENRVGDSGMESGKMPN